MWGKMFYFFQKLLQKPGKMRDKSLESNFECIDKKKKIAQRIEIRNQIK